MKQFLSDLFRDIFKTRPYRRFNEEQDRRRRVLAGLLVIGANVAGVVYLIWLATALNMNGWYITIPFFIAEIGALLAFDFYAITTRYPRFHAPSAPAPERPYSVDVFVTTYDEPVEILRPTLEAARRIDYPNYRVHVLDDGGRPWVRDLANDLGIGYLARPGSENAKAGNLNYALERTERELVLTVDADQVCEPDILSRTVGFFNIPTIAFVQTRQRFIVPEGDPYGNQDRTFYEIMQPGNDTDNAAFSCGSGVIYRRDALEGIGGFSTWNLVEDLHTSMRLHEEGWRSVYFDHPLSTGTTPSNTESVFKQREQWAVDSLRILFWDNPLGKEGLDSTQKIHYFQVGFNYLVSALLMPIFFIAPSWSLFTGEFLIVSTVWSYVLVRGVFFLFQTAAYLAINYPVDLTGKAYRQWAGLFPPFFKATLRALGSRKKKPEYKVTEKPTKQATSSRQIRPVLPHLVLCAVIVAAVVYGAVAETVPWGLFVVDTAWGAWVIWSVSGMIMASLSRKEAAKVAPAPTS